MRQRSIIPFALAAALALGAAGTSGCKRGPEPPAGNIAERLALPSLHGGTFDPSELRGKRVVLNFWRPG